MTGALRVFFICCLLKGSSGQSWGIIIPTSLEALSESCVIIPCRFTVPPEYDGKLDSSCTAIWWKDNTVVFNSSSNSNTMQGKLMGILQQNDCTTIFNNLKSSDDGSYNFTLDCNEVKYNFSGKTVLNTHQDSLPGPTITPSWEGVEGTPVRLNCSAVAPCPILPPVLTWTPTIGDTEENNETNPVTSVRNFTASYLHNGQNFTCTSLYKRQTGTSDLHLEKSLTLHVLFPPKETTITVEPSGPIVEGSSVSLSCSSCANPSVTNYTWYRNDEAFKEHGQILFINRTDPRHSGDYRCRAKNELGEGISAPTALDIQFPPKETTITVKPSGPIVEGSSVSLSCSSCANPSVTNYTWYRNDEAVKEHGQILFINCTDPRHSGDYRCRAKNKLGEGISAPTALDIQFAPEILPSSHCVKNLSQIECTCDSRGSPPPSLVWKLDGEPVNRSADIPVTEVSLGNLTMRSLITLHRVDEDVPFMLCLSFNLLGSDRLAFSVFSSKTQPGHSEPSAALLPVAVVSVIVNVIFIICIVFLWNSRKKLKPDQEDRTYMSMQKKDRSPDYDVIAHRSSDVIAQRPN